MEALRTRMRAISALHNRARGEVEVTGITAASGVAEGPPEGARTTVADMQTGAAKTSDSVSVSIDSLWRSA
jgi:hypothetical protein